MSNENLEIEVCACCFNQVPCPYNCTIVCVNKHKAVKFGHFVLAYPAAFKIVQKVE